MTTYFIVILGLCLSSATILLLLLFSFLSWAFFFAGNLVFCFVRCPFWFGQQFICVLLASSTLCNVVDLFRFAGNVAEAIVCCWYVRILCRWCDRGVEVPALNSYELPPSFTFAKWTILFDICASLIWNDVFARAWYEMISSFFVFCF